MNIFIFYPFLIYLSIAIAAFLPAPIAWITVSAPVIMPYGSSVGISRRIEDDVERRRLRQIFAELKLPKDVGFIVRTAASGKAKQELMRDAQFLYKLWKRLEKIIQQKKAPALIYEEYDLTLRAIRDSFTDDVSKLIVDSKPGI